jgi:capsular exopolysaccharide synthesis family protein
MAETHDSQHYLRPPVAPLAPSSPRSLRAAHSRAGAPAPADTSMKLKPSYFWWVFRQWWMVLVPVTLVLAGVSATFIMLTYEPDYQASAIVKIEESAPYIAFPSGGDGNNRYVETQIELMRSPMVLESLLTKPEIANAKEIAAAEDRVQALYKRLIISRVGSSDLFNVSFVSKSPQLAQTVSNAVVAEYLTIQSRTAYERYQRVIDLLEEERRRRQIDVERLRQHVMDLSKEVTGRDPFGFGSTLDIKRTNSPFAATYMQLTQIDVEREVLKAQIQALQEAAAAPMDASDESSLLQLQVESHETVQQYQAGIDMLVGQIENYKATLNPKLDPMSIEPYRKLVDALAQQREALAKTKVSLREELRTRGREKSKTDADAAIKDAMAQLAALDIRKELLTKKFGEELQGIQSGNSKAVELTFAQAELEREEKVFSMIASRKLGLQTESRAPTRVTVQRAANLPVTPVSKVPVKILMLACLACVAAPFGLAVLREMSIRRISDVEQLSRETSLRVVGEVSHFPIRRAAANGHMLPPKLRRQMFVYLESIDSLRTNLALTEPKANSRVVVVTSAAAAEGKTCLATSLAVSIANAENRPTLVIDGDMRSPDVASVLGTRDRPGLAELLSNQASLSDVIQRVGKTNTYVIAAGRLKGNPHHVVREERLAPLLAQLRSQFPTIVVDTPPVFGGSESLVFAKMADSVLLSVMRDVSRLRQLSVAVERLERSGATVAGTVLNGTSSSSYAYNYGYGYYSGRLDVAEG